VIISAFFLDALNSSRTLSGELQLARGADVKAGHNIHSRLLGAQRNAYLTGITLFLMMILHGFQSMIDNILRMESYLQIAKSDQTGSDPTLAAEIKKKDEELETLQKKLVHAEQIEKSHQALKSQSNNQQRAYDVLSQEYDADRAKTREEKKAD